MTSPVQPEFPSTEKPKRKEKPKGAPRRRWMIVALLFTLLLVGGTALLLLTTPAPTPYVTNFEVQMYPTFSAPMVGSSALAGNTDGYVSVQNINGALVKRQYMLADGNLSHESDIVLQAQSAAASLVISADGAILTSDYGGTTTYIAPDASQTTIALGAPTNITLSGDGSRLAFVNPLGQGALYNAQTLQKIVNLSQDGVPFYGASLQLNGDGSLLAVTKGDGQAVLYGIDGNTFTPMVAGSASWNSRSVFTSDDTFVSVSNTNISFTSATQTKTLLVPSTMASSNPIPAVSSDNRYFVVAVQNNVLIWLLDDLMQAGNGTLIEPRTVANTQTFPIAIAFSPDHVTFGILSLDGTLTVYNAETGVVVATLA